VAFIAGALHNSGEESAPQPESLPVVRDSDGELNHTWLTDYLDVPRDGDPSAREWIDCEQCLMVAVIDVHQVVELTLGHTGFGTREPKVTRLIGKSSDRCREQTAIAPLERADVDGAAIAELQSLLWLTHHGFVSETLVDAGGMSVTGLGRRSHPAFPSPRVRISSRAKRCHAVCGKSDTRALAVAHTCD